MIFISRFDSFKIVDFFKFVFNKTAQIENNLMVSPYRTSKISGLNCVSQSLHPVVEPRNVSVKTNHSDYILNLRV